MKHHFGDLLDRTGDYWSIVPNRERYAYTADEEIKNKEAVKILTISKYDKCWKQIFDCPNIEELTLHEPNKEQICEIRKLTQLTRLRVTHLKTNDINFIADLIHINELILEYVSGFSDLTPLQKLTKIKSIHFENLRRVSSFDGLMGLDSLRYLHIDGMLDWKQPIDNFSFLEGLPNLEVLGLGFVINKTGYPAFLPILKLKKIRKIRIGLATLSTKEYAFLEAAIPDGVCCHFGDLPWTPCYQTNDGSIEFIGKRAGNVKLSSVNANEKIEAFKQKYELYKQEAREFLNNYALHQGII